MISPDIVILAASVSIGIGLFENKVQIIFTITHIPTPTDRRVRNYERVRKTNRYQLNYIRMSLEFSQ